MPERPRPWVTKVVADRPVETELGDADPPMRGRPPCPVEEAALSALVGTRWAGAASGEEGGAASSESRCPCSTPDAAVATGPGVVGFVAPKDSDQGMGEEGEGVAPAPARGDGEFFRTKADSETSRLEPLSRSRKL